MPILEQLTQYKLEYNTASFSNLQYFLSYFTSFIQYSFKLVRSVIFVFTLLMMMMIFILHCSH